MGQDAEVTQARILLDALFEQVAEITTKLETAEMRGLRTSIRGALHDRREQSSLRREFYEVHRLIDGLHKRFPDTLPVREPGRGRRALSAGRTG